MAKFIDSDFFRGVLNRMVEHLEAVDATRDAETIKSVIRFLKVMEEFHAVEVVRCKDCAKDWCYLRQELGPEGFCSGGEMKP